MPRSIRMSDRTYILKRNKFINEAIKCADEKHGASRHGDISHDDYTAAWNLTYHKTMNRLCYESGLASFM